MAVRVPMVPLVFVGEAQRVAPGAVIRVQVGHQGSQRTMTVAEARELRDLLTAAIERAESGEPLPPFPKRVKGPKS